MKTRMSAIRVAVLLSILSLTAEARAEKPINLSLFDPVQIFDRSASVTGVRLTLFYVNNANMTGFDWAFIGVNRATGNMKGVQWGLGNWVQGSGLGWEAAIVNFNGGEMTGLQTGLVNYAGSGVGVQLGTVGWSDNYTGGQIGFLFNYADAVTGLQFGLVNFTRKLHGLQIGLINIAANGFLPVFPIVNAAF